MRYLAIFWACLASVTALYFYCLSKYSFNYKDALKTPVFARGLLDILPVHTVIADSGPSLFTTITDMEEMTELESTKEEMTKWESTQALETILSASETNVNVSNPQKILIYTQGRSGSSFTGALLSASSSAFYVYEPFMRMKVDGVGVENIISEDPSQYNIAKEVLSKIFNCKMTKGETKKNNQKLRMRKQSSRKICSHSSSIVVKTIRMRRTALEQWINQTDIKIVHLVRDPRGIVKSRKMAGWKGESHEAEQVCQKMMNDLKINKSLPEDRYILVRYEDLVDNPMPTLSRLYKHLQLPFTQEVEEYLFNMTHAKQKNGVYGLLRPSSFSHDAWKKSLSEDKIRIIEDQCEEFMEQIGYKKLKGN